MIGLLRRLFGRRHRWHHVVATIDGDLLALYLDGQRHVSVRQNPGTVGVWV